MKFGIVFQPTYFPEFDGSHADKLLGLIDDALYAEELGFDQVWTNEHHFQRQGGILSAPHVFVGALSQRTRRVRLGAAVVVLPHHDPIRVAEEWATLDILSGGRLDVGIGRGFSRWEFHVFGVDKTQDRERLEEGLQVLRQAWSEGRVTYRGEHFEYDGVDVLPRPLQQPHPPLWVSAMASQESFVWAGRHGLNLMLGLMRSDLSFLRANVAAYQQALIDYGHDPTTRQIFAILRVYVAPTLEQAREDSEVCHYRYLALGKANQGDDSDHGRPLVPDPAWYSRDQFPTMAWDDFRAQGKLLVGTPDECVATLSRLHQELGITHFAGNFFFGGLPREKTHQSMALFMREVAPRLRNLGHVDVRPPAGATI